MFPNVVALFHTDLEAEYEKFKEQEASTAAPVSLLTEEALSAFSRLLSKAKKAATEAQAAEARLFRALEDMCIDLNESFPLGNATTFGDAIEGYLEYDEFSHKEIMAKVRELYSKEEE